MKRLIIIFLLTLPVFAQTLVSQSDKSFEILKNLEIFASTYKQLHLHYVDETEPGKLMKTAIDAMLQDLDPYTVYVPEAQIEDFRIMTQGEYEGIGTLIMTRKGATYISEIYEGLPAHKAGLQVGDKITKINGADIQGRNSEEVSTLLKGQAHTELKLTVEREGESKPLEKTLLREAIKFKNVNYSTMLGNEVGYILLDAFTEGAAQEVKNEMENLKKAGMKSLILDLRGNGGGLMNEAIDIVNLFVGKGHLVVSMKGKSADRNQNFKTQNEAVEPDLPLVVLINRGSASSSEIVAGALQDVDRAVILGQSSFGKGLVQNILPLDYKAQLKITTAKYYIPSGRCVQAVDYGKRNEEGYAEKVPDSLRKAFKTKNGRTVYDGDGIEPDEELPVESLGNITLTLFAKLHFFDFATDYFRRHSTLPPVSEFEVSDALFEEFKTFLDGKDCDYSTDTERLLIELEKRAKEERYYEAISADLEKMKAGLKHDKTADIEKHKEEIKQVLAMEIVSRYYFRKGSTQQSLKNDTEVKRAVDLLHQPEKMQSLLR